MDNFTALAFGIWCVISVLFVHNKGNPDGLLSGYLQSVFLVMITCNNCIVIMLYSS